MSEITVTRSPPGEVLLNLIVTLLTPMFLAAAEGDLGFARAAAIETLNAYRAETQADLLTVAKIIGFGLAALSALSLSMAEDLPVAMVLRLHASANASDRSEHRNRAALKHSHPARPTAPAEPEIDEAALAAAAAEMKQRTTEHLAQFKAPAATHPVAPHLVAPHLVAPHLVATNEEKRYQATWAASAAAIAAETAAALPTLSPQERQSAAIWIEVLNESAKDFMAGNILTRPRPGDLASMIPPAA